MEDPYRPPTSSVRAPRTAGEVALSQQSLFGAFFGGALGAFIGVALWIIVVLLSGTNSGWLSLLVAVFVGGFVRFNGRGLTRRYRVIAALFTFVGVVIGGYITAIYGVPLVPYAIAGVVGSAIALRVPDFETEKSLQRLRYGIDKPGDR
ncbi:MAG: hypothetical protein AAFU65_10915 [Pseudomonadota bacterium]